MRAAVCLALFAISSFAAGCNCGGTASGDADAGTPGQEGERCDPFAPLPCEGDLVCIAEECVQPHGDCQTDADCTGDTYCCTGDCLPSGTEGGVCIDYGDGDRVDINRDCHGNVVIGQFVAGAQCEWAGPGPDDPFPEHREVLSTPLVADLPHDSGPGVEIVIVSYNNHNDGGDESAKGSDPLFYGVIRILDGQDCTLLESIDFSGQRVVGASVPAIADLDGDSRAEIVAHRTQSDGGGVTAFRWDDAADHYVPFPGWDGTDTDAADLHKWDGPSIHDLDDDQFPEVIAQSEVYDGRTGARRNAGQFLHALDPDIPMSFSIVGDLERDGAIEYIGDDGIYRWNAATDRWATVPGYAAPPGVGHYAFGDFGTPGATPDEFDPTALDGIAEIVVTGGNAAYLFTLDGQELISVGGLNRGGPPTVGDFDNDGRLEFAAADGDAYRVFDLDCAGGSGADPACAGDYIRWIQPSQDASSARTGSAIFDFDGDGQVEAVYADECFARIYDGAAGAVLFSAERTSCTWFENPVIADPDRDQNTEILIGSNANCAVSCPAIDPIHAGLLCETGADCASGRCDAGYCRCAGNSECEDGYRCVAELAGTPGSGDVCRAFHGANTSGLRVLRDGLDRWASSRPMWNQHAYSITNINDDLSVPPASEWTQNFATEGLNNYRQNVQGETEATDVPDLTARLDGDDVCSRSDQDTVLSATVCNRGTRGVGAATPATFYAGAEVICVSYTAGPVEPGFCMTVSCAISDEVSGEITLVANDDGTGNPATIECEAGNNRDTITIPPCFPVE